MPTEKNEAVGIAYGKLCDAQALAEQEYRATPTKANLDAAVLAAARVRLAGNQP